MGHAIDQDLFQFVQQDLNSLVEKFKKIEEQQLATQDSLVEMQDQQSSKKARLELQDERLTAIEENHMILENLFSVQKSLTEELSTRLKQVEQKLSSEKINGAGNNYCCPFLTHVNSKLQRKSCFIADSLNPKSNERL